MSQTLRLRHEDHLLSHIDSFLESLERRLDGFERFFLQTPAPPQKNLAEWSPFYELLKVLRQSLISTPRIESLQNIFHEHCVSLFDSPTPPDPPDLYYNIQYLENKLQILDRLVEGPKLKYVHYYRHADAVERGKKSTLHYYQLPVLWRENRYIIHGYRFMQRKRDLLRSVFGIHNEMCNIWTHLTGLMIVGLLSVFHLPNQAAWTRGGYDRVSLIVFMIAALNCLLSLTIWHTCTGTSSMAFRNKCVCMDYTGITTLIAASILTAQYLLLYYFPIPQTCCIFVTAALGCVGLYLNWLPRFDRPESRKLRVSFFVFLALSGAICFIFLLWFRGFKHSLGFFLPLIPLFASYLTGVVFYSLLIPEKWRSDVIVDEELPDCVGLCKSITEGHSVIDKHFLDKPKLTGKKGFLSLWWVDYCFSLHAIWHLFVLGGILGHYFGILKMFEDIEQNL